MSAFYSFGGASLLDQDLQFTRSGKMVDWQTTRRRILTRLALATLAICALSTIGEAIAQGMPRVAETGWKIEDLNFDDFVYDAGEIMNAATEEVAQRASRTDNEHPVVQTLSYVGKREGPLYEAVRTAVLEAAVKGYPVVGVVLGRQDMGEVANAEVFTNGEGISRPGSIRNRQDIEAAIIEGYRQHLAPR